MKTIGIKLADGSFYPILEEGSPKKRILDLTTVKDNQTTVQVDLYRSETGSMNDAEYVDTLQVTKLNPHPNGEPELHLSVGIDENNELSAEVVDSETGEKSETQVHLVSRTMTERDNPTNFEISDPLTDPLDLPPEDDAIDPSELAVLEAENDNAEPEKAEESPSEDFSFDDLADETLAEEQNDKTAPAEDPTLLDKEENIELPDFDDSFDTINEEPLQPEETVSSEKTDQKPEDPAFSETDFTVPDFDMPEFKDDSNELAPETEGLTGYFDDPAFKDPVFNTTDLDDNTVKDKAEQEKAPSMDFSNLYDKETLAGEHATPHDHTEDVKKKTRTPVIICIICAIICIIATALILFVIPSRYNLIPSRNTKTTETVSAQEPAVTQEVPAEPETTAPEAAPVEADTVPEPEAAPVEPIVPAPPVPAKKENAQYHIKWGDTLWDIADAYYKNPWRYKKIAQFNHIKNPDLIISGTNIIIPAE